MIILIDKEIVFIKIQHLLMVKAPTRLGIERSYTDIIKAIKEKLLESILNLGRPEKTSEIICRWLLLFGIVIEIEDRN